MKTQLADHWTGQYHNSRHTKELPSFATFVSGGKQWVLTETLQTVCQSDPHNTPSIKRLSVEKPIEGVDPIKTIPPRPVNTKKGNGSGKKQTSTHNRRTTIKNGAVITSGSMLYTPRKEANPGINKQGRLI